MKIDPADPRLLRNHNPQTNGGGEIMTEDQQQEEEDTKQCWICDVQVGAKSMHCRFCNKCVDGFDHHCMCKFVSPLECWLLMAAAAAAGLEVDALKF